MEALDNMPDKFKGEILKPLIDKNGNRLHNGGRKWTKEEEDWIMDKVSKGYSYREIAEKVDRGTHSVSLKVKRLKKKNGTYNQDHYQDKYSKNTAFYEYLRPETALDCFSGTKRYWKNMLHDNAIDNDINKNIPSDYNLDSSKFLDLFEGSEFDLVDLDPFGGVYDYVDKGYHIAKKGLILTLGELGHLRWKRLDYVQPRYGIDTLESFTPENLVSYYLNKYPDLRLHTLANYKNISRVYFVKKDYYKG